MVVVVVVVVELQEEGGSRVVKALLIVRKIQVAQSGQLLDGHLSYLVARGLQRLQRRKLCTGRCR